MAWTEEQLLAMDARGSDILVSAAAGSGKTAVLVERIFKLVCAFLSKIGFCVFFRIFFFLMI